MRGEVGQRGDERGVGTEEGGGGGQRMRGTMARMQVITRYLHYPQAGGMKAHSTASTTSVQTSFLLCSEKKPYFTHIHVYDLSLPSLPPHTHTHTHTHTHLIGFCLVETSTS